MGAKRPRRRKPSVSKANRKRNKAMIERSLNLLNNHATTFRNELKTHSESNKRDKELQDCTELVNEENEQFSSSEHQIEDAVAEFSLLKCP
ncbi:unnamed protein product [Schistosoma turkestanicum]|nr:unnamed protein product [Schistosoma turkestanicum]